MALYTEPASLRLATWRNILIMIDQGAHRPSEYSEAERIFNDYAYKCGGKAGVLTIIPSHSKAPEPESQKAISSAIDRMAERIDGFVWVVEGTGFTNAFLRATLMTIQLAKRKSYPSRVASNISEGLAWIVSRRAITMGVSIEQGVAVAEELRNPTGHAASRDAVRPPVTSRSL